MKVRKIIHVRSPLVVRNHIGKKEVSPVVVPDRIGMNGGCTIILEGDTDNPSFVQMKVAFCRFSDNYNKKLGIKTADKKDPEVVPLRLLARELQQTEEQMLMQVVPYLRKQPVERADCMRDWNFVTRFFLPVAKKEEAHG